jgi:hypothetical protein
MQSRRLRLLHVLQDLAGTIRAVRAPLLLAFLAFVVLGFPAQVLEIYLTLIRNWSQLWPQSALAVASLVSLGFLITFVARGLISANDAQSEDRPSQPRPFFQRFPCFIGLLPLLGAAYGLYRALQGTLTDPMRRAIDVFNAVATARAVDETVRSIDAVGDADAKITALFIGDWVPRPDAETLASLADVIREHVPHTILELQQKTAALRSAAYLAIALCLALALLHLLFWLAKKPIAQDAQKHPKDFSPRGGRCILRVLCGHHIYIRRASPEFERTFAFRLHCDSSGAWDDLPGQSKSHLLGFILRRAHAYLRSVQDSPAFSPPCPSFVDLDPGLE